MTDWLCHKSPLLLAFALFVHGMFLTERVSAIQTESQEEKQANFKQQALGGLFQRWTFDQQKPEEALGDFSQLVVGGDSATVWTIGADTQAPSPPNILRAASSCQTSSCYHLLIANKLQYEYPDVTVRLRFPADSHIQDDLVQSRNSHLVLVAELLHKRRHDLGHVTIFQSCRHFSITRLGRDQSAAI